MTSCDQSHGASFPKRDFARRHADFLPVRPLDVQLQPPVEARQTSMSCAATTAETRKAVQAPRQQRWRGHSTDGFGKRAVAGAHLLG
jgi:hypothetical protein